MNEHREQRIRERAYALWEADRRPDETAENYWLLAESLIDAEDDPAAPDMTARPPL